MIIYTFSPLQFQSFRSYIRQKSQYYGEHCQTETRTHQSGRHPIAVDWDAKAVNLLTVRTSNTPCSTHYPSTFLRQFQINRHKQRPIERWLSQLDFMSSMRRFGSGCVIRISTT